MPSIEDLIRHGQLFNFTARGLSASLSTTTLEKVPQAGTYRLVAVLATNTPGTGNVSLAVVFTDDVGLKTVPVGAALALNSNELVTGSLPFVVARGPISFSTTYTATGTYNLYIVLERLQ